jgi:glutamate synthase domain-containing protein 1/glutamate synthase domain-containing protein 3
MSTPMNLPAQSAERDFAAVIQASRRTLPTWARQPEREAEGGCGVIGMAASFPVAGRHIIRSVGQMRNRGNGKGGGLALVGCFPCFPDHYALNIGYLEAGARDAVEAAHVWPHFDVAEVEEQPHADDHRAFGLEIAPPHVVRYFARVKPGVLARFAETHGFADEREAEDEFVYQNSFRLNKSFYGDREDKQAFVLSHGRNMMILKAVGYAEDIARYYLLDDVTAHVWIGHQRYPTRGRVWHPGGAHPYIGLDEALVHNGDFANYYAVSEYLKQRGYEPLFLTDTEVSVLLFDLYHRVYRYPLELVIEALAPTTERDFALLPPEKQRIYRAVQRAHLHGSPDGPWFFIIARNDVRGGVWQLVGITDTSMLRPQVFAWQERVGVIASEQQAIDAALRSLASEGESICWVPDKVWVARGGSHSDGGAFAFSVVPENGGYRLDVTDKFGRAVEGLSTDSGNGLNGYADGVRAISPEPAVRPVPPALNGRLQELLDGEHLDELYAQAIAALPEWDLATFQEWCERVVELGSGDRARRWAALALLSRLHDWRYPTGTHRRSRVLAVLNAALDRLFESVPGFEDDTQDTDRRLTWATRDRLDAPSGDGALFIDARDFPAEGDDSVARALVRGHALGWRRFVVFACRGDRFLGCGLGPKTHGVRIDIYGASGDYLGSGLDGAEIHVHGDAQDQLGQILTNGKLVIYGNVGQTFLYGAKGGTAYVMGNAAGRPLINAVGRVRAIINGTCLDYAAESFMAGAETGGGFVCINGVRIDAEGRLLRLAEPYPGGNFFSLASGGAGYVNDPARALDAGQLNGAIFVSFSAQDWDVLLPHLEENAALFGIAPEALLTVDGESRAPEIVYRKVVPVRQMLTERGT